MHEYSNDLTNIMKSQHLATAQTEAARLLFAENKH